MNVDIGRGADWDDLTETERYAMSEAPLVVGELGAGFLPCPTCGTVRDCGCDVPTCYRNEPTYLQYGCDVEGCVKHANR